MYVCTGVKQKDLVLISRSAHRKLRRALERHAKRRMTYRKHATFCTKAMVDGM